jgi:cobalt-zinc-cadmium efflux system outer membrane protein
MRLASIRHRRLVAAAAAALGALAGCGRLSPPLRAEIAAAAAPLAPAVDDDHAVVAAGRAGVAGTPAPAAWPLAPDAGLERYVAEALARNPAIHAAVREVQGLGYRVPQVTSLDDPMVSIVPPTGDMIETAAGMMDGSVGVTQRIPYPGKLRAKGRIAEQAVRVALDRLADVRIRTVADVRRAYYQYYLAQVSDGLTRRSADLLRQIHDVATARYRSGLATQQDVLRAEVELYGLTNELIAIDQQAATAVARLNALMDRRVDASLPAPSPLDLAAVDWKLEDAMGRAVEASPRIAARRNQLARDLEAVKLARLQYVPDLTVGYTYTFIAAPALSPVATGDDAWNLSLGVNLPIWWQRLRAGVLEGNAQVLRSVAELEEVRNLVFFALQDTLARIDTHYRRAVIQRDVIVPRAWQAVEVSLSDYEAGRLEFTAVIDNWRKWLDHSLAYERSLAALEQAFADLEQLVGVRIGRSPAIASPAVDGRVP